jgi:tetratricopeptide (TPR) repeat protein/O-antigen ligase
MDVKLFPFGVALLLASGFTLLQVVPLPLGLVKVLSPGMAEVCEHVCSGTKAWSEWRALSMAPPETALELVKFLAYALVFIVVVNYFNDRRRARRLLKMVAWSGFTVALVGFFSKLFVAKAIYGVVPVASHVFFFSTFVNPNHLAGFLGLCSPVAFGLALSARERQDRALYGFMGVIIGVAVFMSLSRGGIVAFCVGCIFLFFFAATRRARKLRRVATVQALAAGVLVLAGYLAYDTIIKEMQTLGDFDAVREDTKIRSWAGTLPMMADHPVVGIGRGAYATVYPRYKTVANDLTFTHAENGILQNMVDWGPVFGFLFMGVFAITFLLALGRARQSYSMGGCLAGVFIVAAHNIVDFNLETGGVALPFTMVLGILVASPFSHAGGPKPFETRFRMPRVTGMGLVPVAVVIGVMCVPYTAAHHLERGTSALLDLKKPEAAEPCSDTPLGRAACELMRYHPGDYMAPLVVGKAYLEAKPPNLERAGHWLARAMHLHPTSSVIHRLAGRALYLVGKRDQALVEYRLAAKWDPSVLTATAVEVLRLTNDPEAVIRATPDEAKAHMTVARILRNLGKVEAAERAAKVALELDSALLAAIDMLGVLALEDGRMEEAIGYARQAIQVNPLHDAAYYLQGQVHFKQGQSDKAESVWLSGLSQKPDSSLLAYRLGELYLTQGRFQEAEGIAGKLQAFAPSDDRSQARLSMLVGRIHEAKGMLFEARRSYQMASSLAPGVSHYLYQVGRMEERMGNWTEAERIYLQLQNLKFQPKLIEEKLEVVRKAGKESKDQAMWDTWVDKKEE